MTYSDKEKFYEPEFQRTQFLSWIKNDTKDVSWRNYCIKYWLYELGGLAAVW